MYILIKQILYIYAICAWMFMTSRELRNPKFPLYKSLGPSDVNYYISTIIIKSQSAIQCYFINL